MFGLGIGIIFANFQIWGMIFLLRDRFSIFVRQSSPLGPRCFKCLMFSPSGPVELVFFGGFEGCRGLCYCDFYGGGW